MKPALQIRQSQQLALTPQLQQAIRLLQLSTFDLHQEIEQALAHNPLLERVDDPWDKRISLGPDGNLRPSSGSTADAGWQPGQFGTDAAEPSTRLPSGSAEQPQAGHEPPVDTYPADELGSAEDPLWGFDTSGGTARRNDFDDGERDHTSTLAQTPSLHEHLVTQLAGTLCPSRQREIVRALIEEVDDNGYLQIPLDEWQAPLPPGSDLTQDDLQQALRILQGFDPAGVGARSLNECLLLQLTDPDMAASLPAEPLALARRIIEQDLLPMLATHKEQHRLARLLHCRDDLLQQAIALIRSLNPKPGNRFGSEPPQYAIPDVFVRKTSQGWQAVLNRHEVPQLRVNEEYERLLKAQPPPAGDAPRARRAPHPGIASAQQEAPAASAWLNDPFDPDDRPASPLEMADLPGSQDDEGKAWRLSGEGETRPDPLPAELASRGSPATVEDSLSRQLQEARQMIRHVEHRFDTILRVARAIVERQQAFFNHGPVAMRPLVLREIAEALDLHESTISRATRQKYMETPFGTFELKYFFGSHVATDTGGAASSTAIRAQIERLIKEEDTKQPLSDNQITELLGQQGIKVARRTVAKYRESLGIRPADQRKTR